MDFFVGMHVSHCISFRHTPESIPWCVTLPDLVVFRDGSDSVSVSESGESLNGSFIKPGFLKGFGLFISMFFVGMVFHIGE